MGEPDGASFFGKEASVTLMRALRTHEAFASLRQRDFRWFWIGRLASFATMEMGSVARGWLAYQLTGSALALAWVSSGRSLARMGLSLYAGALADRFEKRQLLIVTRGATALNTLVVAILILTGTIRVWHLAASSVVGGAISSFMMPAQKAYLSELVGSGALLNALSLTSLARGLVGIVGATAAGFAIEWLGVDSVYFFMAVLHVVCLLTLAQLPLLGTHDAEGASVWEDLQQGLRHLRAYPAIPPLLGIAAVRALFGWSHRTLMPVYADEVLHLGASGLGILSAAPSVGALVGSFLLAAQGDMQGKGKILLIAFAITPYFAVAIGALMIIGATRDVTRATNQTLLQVTCAPDFRGRVMAMYMMIMGLMPLGTLTAAAIADTAGVSLALVLPGIIMLAIYALFWLGGSRVKRLC